MKPPIMDETTAERLKNNPMYAAGYYQGLTDQSQVLTTKSNINDEPFNFDERIILQYLTQAHNAFVDLGLGRAALDEWIISFHRLQDILIREVVRRDYPETFNSPIK